MADKNYEVTAEVVFTLSKEDIEDIISSALCGGIGYWASLDNTTPEFKAQPEDECIDTWTAKILMDGGTVYLIDNDEDEVYELTLKRFLNGVRKFVERGYDRYGCFRHNYVDTASIDSECADSIIQLGLFGEVIYG